jgi:hypothetical protein
VIAGGGFCAEPDALAISARIQARHLPFGTIADPIFASSTSEEITGYTRCGDSAIWTGHYLAAESFRYKVTADPAALANASRALAGLELLVDVTGTDLLARCAVPADSPYAPGIASEERHNGVYSGQADLRQYLWIGRTSRDQYSGVLFGLTAAFDLIGDRSIRSRAAALALRMLDYLEWHDWNVVMPNGWISTTFAGRDDQRLAFLQIGRHLSPRYSGKYRIYAFFHYFLVPVPIALEVTDVYGSYFKFNLDTINLYNLIRLEDSGARRSAYKNAYEILRRTTDDHGNAHFNMIDHALNGPDARRDAETLALLEAWLKRPQRDLYVDLRGRVPVCGDQACEPVPVELRVPTDFLWQRNPFQLDGGGDGFIESAGIDYILPYWMARYYGLLN